MLILFLGIFYGIYVKIAPTDTIPLRFVDQKIHVGAAFDACKGLVFSGGVKTT